MTGPRYRLGPDDDPEMFTAGVTFPAGSIIELERGVTWVNKRVVLTGAGTAEHPVVLCAAGTGPDPVFTDVTKPGRFKDDGVVSTEGTHVHVRDITVRDSLSVAFNANATSTVLHNVEAGNVVIGAWLRGDGTRMWNSYAHDLRMMPDTPGPDDDYGSVGAVINAHNVVIEGFTGRSCITPSGTDYGPDGAYVEVWEKGDNAQVRHGYADRTVHLMEGGGLGESSSAKHMRVHGVYLRRNAGDPPFYFNPVGQYAGLDVTGFQEWDNVVTAWKDPATPAATSFTFTGLTNGAPWPAPWAASTAVNGTVTVQGQEGELRTGTAGGYAWQDQARVNYPAAATPADAEVVFTMRVTGTERTPRFYLRNPGDSPDSDTQRVEVRYEWDGVQIVEVQAGVAYPLGAKIPGSPFAAPTKTRVRVDGNQLQVRTWVAANAEPGVWDRQLTLTRSAAAGSMGFFVVGSAVAAAQFMYVDDVTVTDLRPLVSNVTVTAPPVLTVPAGEPGAGRVTAVTGDSAPVTITADVLPAGVTLDPGRGVLGGVPTMPGITVTTWTATSASGAVGTATTTWNVTRPAPKVQVVRWWVSSGFVQQPPR